MRLARYVKFFRGTPASYNKLAVKDNDTLYVISEEGSLTGQLYLGSKLIGGEVTPGGGGSSSVASLKDLQDVLISEGLSDESFLVYNSEEQKWENCPIEDLIFVGATDGSSGSGGFVPAPEAGDNHKFLRGDGSWAVPTFEPVVNTYENTDMSVHSDLIASKNLKAKPGDIVIIKDFVGEGVWQYTAYVYSNNAWCAMDGNYDASNVYFSEDLITTTEVGNITLTNGQATIKSAGKNLKQVFETIFVKEANPETANPEVSIVFNQAGAYEVGSKVTPSYSASLSAGSYTYGPATGITAKTWSVSDSDGNSKTSASGTFPEIVVADNENYTITAVASYDDGAIPFTNLSNEYPDGQIKAGSASSTSGAITGYRNSFYGTFAEKKDLTSADIRTLTKSDFALYNGVTKVVKVPVGAMRVVFAYPSTLKDLSSVKDKNGLEAEIISSFTSTIVSVSGANGYDSIEYKVYYIDYARANDAENYYTFKI